MQKNALAILCGIIVAITPLMAFSAEPPDIDIKYLYRHEGSKQFKILTEGSILYSGDFYKILFAPATTEKTDIYVYVFQTDSSDNIYRLFPMKSFAGVTVNNFNPVQPGITRYIPAKKKSFFLDEQIGKEQIYFLATRQPDTELENQYQQVLLARSEQNPEKIQSAQETLRQRLKACEGCVNVLKFLHR